MGLNQCGQLCKWFLIFFNVAVANTGIAMLALCVWIKTKTETKEFFDRHLITNVFVIGMIVLIVLGVLLFLVAAFGEFSALKENRTALKWFSVLLSILVVVLIAAGVIAYMKHNEVGEQTANLYKNVNQKASKSDIEMVVILRMIQKVFQCCGVSSEDIMCAGSNPTLPTCPDVIINQVKFIMLLVMGLFFGTAVMLIVALVCSFLLSKEIKRSQTTPTPYMQQTIPTHPNSAQSSENIDTLYNSVSVFLEIAR